MKSGWAWVLPAALVLAGCTPTAPPTTPAPTPTFMCTPEAGGAESPCSQQDYEKMKARDAQYAEAEKVYREFTGEVERILRAGGATKLSSTLSGLVVDSELQKSVLAQLESFKVQGLHLKGPGLVIKSVQRLPGRVLRDSTVTMKFCVDASESGAYRGAKKEQSLAVSRETMYFRAGSNGLLRIIAGDYEVVQSC